MPIKAPTACPRPGCLHSTPCPDHGQSGWANHERIMPPGWAATRTRILTRDPTCRACALAPSTEVDHVIRGGGEHDGNLQGLCGPCHARKTSAEANAAKALL